MPSDNGSPCDRRVERLGPGFVQIPWSWLLSAFGLFGGVNCSGIARRYQYLFGRSVRCGYGLSSKYPSDELGFVADSPFLGLSSFLVMRQGPSGPWFDRGWRRCPYDRVAVGTITSLRRCRIQVPPLRQSKAPAMSGHNSAATKSGGVVMLNHINTLHIAQVKAMVPSGTRLPSCALSFRTP